MHASSWDCSKAAGRTTPRRSSSLRAIRSVPRARAYTYWLAIASALLETDQTLPAKAAAEKAIAFAATSDQREAAALALLAVDTETDVTV